MLVQQLNCVCNTMAKRLITLAIHHSYHGRQSQFLPKEDVALVIWGDKDTGNISTPLRFHTSKVVARKHLATCKKDKWPNKRFDMVDWEHLDLALKNKADMYKLWQSKQHSDFCGTRVKFGRYFGKLFPDERCPNCGRRETAVHLMLCPDYDRTRLLIDNVDELTAWLAQDNKTNPEILYWIPKYILMQGDKPLSKMEFMSPQFKALAAKQDLIGWRDFMEGHISTHFYAIQSFHLAMSSSYLNGEDWTKQFISRILHIMHSQWIFRNVSLHDRMHGYLRNQKAKEILHQINVLSDLAPEEIPEASGFLLEIYFSKLSKSHLKTQKYWMLAVDAALKAKALKLARGQEQNGSGESSIQRSLAERS